MPASSVMPTFRNAIATNGMILPSISSQGLIGVTISCSIVPCSRSRTIATAVSISACICSTEPIMPGSMKLICFMSGL